MAASVFKLIALGGSAIIGGGTIVNQAFFSSDKQEQPKTQTKEEVVTPTNTGVTCTIYEAEKYPTLRGFKKIKAKLGSKEDFFKAREQDSQRIWNLDSLKQEIEAGCQRSKTHRIYIWHGPVHGRQNTWVFGSDLSGEDWLKRDDVEIPEELRLRE